MTCLSRALHAELLKSRRTLMVALSFLAPLALAFLELVVCFQGEKKLYEAGGDSWMILIDQTCRLWLLLLLPLFVTLQMGLMGAMEHNNKAWKQLYTRALPRWSIYMAKQLIGTGLIGLSSAVLGLMIVGVGIISRTLLPDLGFDASIPWASVFTTMLYTFLAAWFMISIHLFISLYSSSFVAAMGVGIVASVINVVAINSQWKQYYPWIMPGLVAMDLFNGDAITLPLSMGIIGGVLVACLGCIITIRRDVLQ